MKLPSGKDTTAVRDWATTARTSGSWQSRERDKISHQYPASTAWIAGFELLSYETAGTAVQEVDILISTRQLHLQVSNLTEIIGHLSAKIASLEMELHNRPLFTSLTIYDLNSEKLNVILPISVIIEETDEEVLARWPEVRASGIGTTMSQALQYLKEDIVDVYEDLLSRDIETLGQIALETRARLLRFIKEE